MKIDDHFMLKKGSFYGNIPGLWMFSQLMIFQEFILIIDQFDTCCHNWYEDNNEKGHFLLLTGSHMVILIFSNRWSSLVAHTIACVDYRAHLTSRIWTFKIPVPYLTFFFELNLLLINKRVLNKGIEFRGFSQIRPNPRIYTGYCMGN